MKKTMQLADNLYGIDSPFTVGEEIYVRSYLILGSNGVALVDGGVVGTDAQVLALMDDLGIKRSRLKAVLVSHAHADHVGAIEGLREATGCVAVVHRNGAEMMRDKTLMYQDFMGAFPAHISIPEPVREQWFAITGGATHPDIQFGDEGVRLDLGDVVLDAIPAPGHSSDSVCFYEPNRHWLFIGDSVCGTGPFEEPPCYRDATVYRSTLTRLGKLAVDRLFPGHFAVLEGGQAKELLDVSLRVVDRIDAAVREQLKQAAGSLSLEQVGQCVADTTGKGYMTQALFTAKAHLLELERLGLVGKYGSENANYRWLA